MRNILEDALYEMGYDDTLVDTLIERNVIDFSTVDYTSHIIYQLEEHYGESILWGDLEDAVAREGLDTSLTGLQGKNWRASEGGTFRERVKHIITDPIEKFGMKVIACAQLRRDNTFSEELENLKRHLAIDYGEFGPYIPHVDIVIYNPANSRVIAVVSCRTNLKNNILEMAYWKFKLQVDEDKASIKFYLITADLDETLKITNLPTRGRAIVETDLDGISCH